MDDYDQDKVDEMVLALLYLGIHEGYRTWKSFDWDAMDRLYEKGLISDPQSKAKSVVFTEKGFAKSASLFQQHFSKSQEG